MGYQVLSWLQPEIELNYGHDYLAVEEDQEALAATVGLIMPVNEKLRVNKGRNWLWGKNLD